LKASLYLSSYLNKLKEMLEEILQSLKTTNLSNTIKELILYPLVAGIQPW